MTDRCYDTLKWVVAVVLPATIGLVQGVGEVLQWGYTQQAVELLSVMTVFLGALMQQSTKRYWKEQKKWGWKINSLSRQSSY
ncbi:MAG: phage holin [Aerococcus sp.]|nr:phage holin [Aerococcus sp.]